MRFGSVFLRQKLGFFHRLYFVIFGLPNLTTYIIRVNIQRVLSKKNVNPKKIVDIGGGSGAFSFFIAEHFPNAKIICLDKKLDKALLHAFATARGIKNVCFVEKDFFDFKQKGFDLAFSTETFEHFPKIDVALRKSVGVLKKGGFLLMHVPSAEWGNFAFFNRKHFPDYLNFLQKEHLSNNISLDSLCKQLSKSGFSIIIAKKTFGTLARFCWETDLLLMEKKQFYLRALLLPMLKLLSSFDPFLRNSSGKGILLLAQIS